MDRGSPLSDVEYVVNVGSGVLHVTPVLDHGLANKGTCLLMGILVQDSPVVHHSLGVAEEGGSGIPESLLLIPIKIRLHCINTVASGIDVECVFLPWKTGIFFLLNCMSCPLKPGSGLPHWWRMYRRPTVILCVL